MVPPTPLTLDAEWRPIPGFPGYEINRSGEVRSYHRRRFRGYQIRLDLPPRPMSVYFTSPTVKAITLTAADGTFRCRSIAKLVRLAFGEGVAA